MLSSIPNSDALNWVIGPAGQCVTLVGEETRIASILMRAIVALAKQGPLLELTRREFRRNNQSEVAINKLLLEQSGLAEWAEEIISNDYDPINRHGIIGLWVAVEVAVEDTAVLILSKDTNAVTKVKRAGIKLPKSRSKPPPELEARRIYKRLETHARSGQSVSEGYRVLMSVLEVELTIPSETSVILSELNYVRNCLMHRAGIADEKSSQEAPRLGLSIGEPIKIGSKQYLRYFDAVTQFAQALLNGVMSSRYVQTQ